MFLLHVKNISKDEFVHRGRQKWLSPKALNSSFNCKTTNSSNQLWIFINYLSFLITCSIKVATRGSFKITSSLSPPVLKLSNFMIRINILHKCVVALPWNSGQTLKHSIEAFIKEAVSENLQSQSTFMWTWVKVPEAVAVLWRLCCVLWMIQWGCSLRAAGDVIKFRNELRRRWPTFTQSQTFRTPAARRPPPATRHRMKWPVWTELSEPQRLNDDIMALTLPLTV